VLPFPFLGGAAAQVFQARRYELGDRLGSGVDLLHQQEGIDQAVTLAEQLSGGELAKALQATPLRFFISYPRSRPHEADFVETTLRRRNFQVFRDERDFEAGRPIPREITESIHRANVFVAIWCKDYACSPWCFDEFELALNRHEQSGLALWILCVDDTRIVPPAARSLVNYPARSREELERHVLTLLEQIQQRPLTP
jgi:hypothetical protein